MVTRLTPRLWPGFLDSQSLIKALDLDLLVWLTSWRPELGRSGPEGRVSPGMEVADEWVDFFMFSHK